LGEQTDHETDDEREALPFLSQNLLLLSRDHASDDEHGSCVDPMTRHDSPVPLHDATQSELTTQQMSIDSFIEIGNAQQRNEVTDLDDQEDRISSTVNVNYLCGRTVALLYFILTSVIGKPCPNS
jgi:hypothetical protein